MRRFEIPTMLGGGKNEQAQALYCIVFDAPRGAPLDAAEQLARHGYTWVAGAWHGPTESKEDDRPARPQ